MKELAASPLYLRTNPCRLVTLPRVEKHEIEPLDDEQIAMLLTIAEEDEIFGILLKVIVLTGLRKSEAIGLTWDCVDFKRGTLHINKQLQKRPKSAGGFVFASLKNGKGRTLKPAPYVMELLRHRYEQQIQHKENAQEAWVGWKTEAEHKKALVFTNLFGEHLHPQTVYSHFKKVPLRSAPQTPGCMICVILSPFCPFKTAMITKPCNPIWAMQQQLLPSMFTVMFRTQ